jgi:hypothetical protein
MSKYKRINTKFTDRDALVAALEACELPFEEGEALSLYGFEGRRRRETANVVVRRQHVGSLANDLGFTWNQAEGRYDVIISEYDEHGPGQRRLKTIKQEYARRQVYALAEENGYTVQEVPAEGGVVRLQLVRW